MQTILEGHEVTNLALFDQLLTDWELELREKVRLFCQREIAPIINEHWEAAQMPAELPARLADLGLAGGSLAAEVEPPVTPVAEGLIAAEFASTDGSIRDFQAVHDLVMGVISAFGNEEQKSQWLPQMRRMETIGAFALTEPGHGSDASSLETTAVRDGQEYVLKGSKRWITNAPVADLILTWGREDDGRIGAYLVEVPTDGLNIRPIAGKAALRAVPHGEIDLDEVRIHKDHKLNEIHSFKDVAWLLTRSRTLVAWEAIGHARAAYETALTYSLEREQFGQRLASFQLVQAKLAQMLMDITGAELMCWRASSLVQENLISTAMAAGTKANATAVARRVTADARDILGGEGLLLENHVARHHADMEAVFTYEGTYDICRLIVGRHITGISAFS